MDRSPPRVCRPTFNNYNEQTYAQSLKYEGSFKNCHTPDQIGRPYELAVASLVPSTGQDEDLSRLNHRHRIGPTECKELDHDLFLNIPTIVL